MSKRRSVRGEEWKAKERELLEAYDAAVKGQYELIEARFHHYFTKGSNHYMADKGWTEESVHELWVKDVLPHGFRGKFEEYLQKGTIEARAELVLGVMCAICNLDEMQATISKRIVEKQQGMIVGKGSLEELRKRNSQRLSRRVASKEGGATQDEMSRRARLEQLPKETDDVQRIFGSFIASANQAFSILNTAAKGTGLASVSDAKDPLILAVNSLTSVLPIFLKQFEALEVQLQGVDSSYGKGAASASPPPAMDVSKGGRPPEGRGQVQRAGTKYGGMPVPVIPGNAKGLVLGRGTPPPAVSPPPVQRRDGAPPPPVRRDLLSGGHGRGGAQRQRAGTDVNAAGQGQHADVIATLRQIGFSGGRGDAPSAVLPGQAAGSPPVPQRPDGDSPWMQQVQEQQRQRAGTAPPGNRPLPPPRPTRGAYALPPGAGQGGGYSK